MKRGIPTIEVADQVYITIAVHVFSARVAGHKICLSPCGSESERKEALTRFAWSIKTGGGENCNRDHARGIGIHRIRVNLGFDIDANIDIYVGRADNHASIVHAAGIRELAERVSDGGV